MSELEEVPKQTEVKESSTLSSEIPWNPWVGVLAIIVIFFIAEYAGSILVNIVALIPYFLHGARYANNWLTNNVFAQFLYIIFAETATIGSIYLFLRFYKRKFGSIGLHRPRWRDPLYGLLAVPFYLIVYLLTVGVVSNLVHGLNVNEQQQIGFNNVHGAVQLIVTAISLCILPPLTEEIMVRGFLYSSLKKGMSELADRFTITKRIVPQLMAALVTSALFASAHLPEGGAAGPLWIAALDTFVLSLFLILLRELTKNLWASMTLHALKNGIAFYALFLAPLFVFKKIFGI
jgi:membrane protease YdiL (CAAX protease family)